MMHFREYVFTQPYFGWLCSGILFTLLITIVTGMLACAIGTAVMMLRTARSGFYRVLGIVFVSVFRNIPPVPLLLFLVFGLPGIFTRITGYIFPPNMVIVLLLAGLSLNTAAYIAEILRSGVSAVPLRHYDSARILGLSEFQIRFRIIYPEAFRIALPSLGTRLIHNMKNSTIALVLPLSVGQMEVLGQAGRIAGQTFVWAEPLIFAGVVHLSLALVLGGIVRHLARSTQRKVESSE